MNGNLILVDEQDREIGEGEKMDVHRKGQLHRAFSIFVLNDQNELLIQRRAKVKYHSGGLWGNTCCSHPIKGERQEVTVHRRLREEMGFDCDLKEVFSFIYRADLDKGLVEHEYDYVYFGRFNGTPVPNPEEVDEYKWIALDKLDHELEANPDEYVYWIKPAFKEFYKRFSENSIPV
ncbi:MAG: isopentenyl-diphosphate Delta-isomerase [Bacteroidota bacterium]